MTLIWIRVSPCSFVASLPKRGAHLLAEAGCSDADIQAITGQSAAMVVYNKANAIRRAQ
ncbi:hypothetical protein LZG00_08605 [Rhodobacteraceae bacterium LMO-12]|nr:hypothetical protein [Rhodobacteraceae bacterium LMO-JJ12]